MSNLDAFITHTKEIPKAIATSQEIRDRGSTFVASVYAAKDTTEARQAINHVKNVLHATHPATHEMAGWRCMMLKDGKIGLGGPDDFQMVSNSEDDGEEFGGRRVMRTMAEEGVIDAVVIVSRWYGGTMLGSARFRHIELCTREVCRSFRNYEEIQSAVSELERMDAEIANLRAQLASSIPPPLVDHGENVTIFPPMTPKVQDYLKLLDPPDLPKTKRLLSARQNALRTVRGLIAKAQQK